MKRLGIDRIEHIDHHAVIVFTDGTRFALREDQLAAIFTDIEDFL